MNELQETNQNVEVTPSTIESDEPYEEFDGEDESLLESPDDFVADTEPVEQSEKDIKEVIGDELTGSDDFEDQDTSYIETFNEFTDGQSGEIREVYTSESVENLERTDNFRESAIHHIFDGDINRSGQATGYHTEIIQDSRGDTVEGTKTPVDANGCYKAEVTVDGVAKTANGGESSFFPEEMKPQEIIDCINEAYDDRVYLYGNVYEGESESGIVIQMFLDSNEKIISAFPIYEGDV